MTSVPSRPNPVLFSLFGAPGDTGNLGVSALGESTLQSVAVERPEAKVLRFDNSRGRRRSPPNAAVSHDRDGAWISRRMYRSESLWTMRVSSVVRFPPNRNVEAIRRSAAVLDVSGGDSFTDLYGARRWHLVTLPKLISLRVGTPLVLLPQTYGPFRDPRRRRQAADIVANAQAAWARDPDGLDFLRELLGDRFDPTRHRQGVDVAFALSPRRPDELPDDLVACLDPARDHVTVGLNVSGLLMNEPDGGKSQFGLELDYRQLIDQVSSRLLDEVADHLVLVPHVRGQSARVRRPCLSRTGPAARSPRQSEYPAGGPRRRTDQVVRVAARLVLWNADAFHHCCSVHGSSGCRSRLQREDQRSVCDLRDGPRRRRRPRREYGRRGRSDHRTGSRPKRGPSRVGLPGR